jgi:hypothetical protein
MKAKHISFLSFFGTEETHAGGSDQILYYLLFFSSSPSIIKIDEKHEMKKKKFKRGQEEKIKFGGKNKIVLNHRCVL